MKTTTIFIGLWAVLVSTIVFADNINSEHGSIPWQIANSDCKDVYESCSESCQSLEEQCSNSRNNNYAKACQAKIKSCRKKCATYLERCTYNN